MASKIYLMMHVFSTLIDTTCIGILARLKEVLYNIGLLTPSTRKSSKVSFPKPKFDCAKKQSIKRIVDMVAQKIRQSKLLSKQIKHEEVDMVAQKMVKASCCLSKLNMKTLIPLL
jgi:hypothetical protein